MPITADSPIVDNPLSLPAAQECEVRLDLGPRSAAPGRTHIAHYSGYAFDYVNGLRGKRLPWQQFAKDAARTIPRANIRRDPPDPPDPGLGRTAMRNHVRLGALPADIIAITNQSRWAAGALRNWPRGRSRRSPRLASPSPCE